MASSTRSAGSIEFGAGDRLHLPVDPHAVQRRDLAVLARESRWVMTAKSRSAPSSWLEEVRSFSGQSGQVSELVLLLRRLRHDLELGHREGALADRGADAVGAGIAAADDDDVLAAGEDGLARSAAARPLTRRFCCGRKSMAKWMPSSSRPGIGRSRGFSAPPASTSAS